MLEWITTTGCMRRTALLELMLGLTQFSMFIREVKVLTTVQLNKFTLWRHLRTPHTEVLYKLVQKDLLLEADVNRIPKQFILDKIYLLLYLFEKPNEGNSAIERNNISMLYLIISTTACHENSENFCGNILHTFYYIVSACSCKKRLQFWRSFCGSKPLHQLHAKHALQCKNLTNI